MQNPSKCIMFELCDYQFHNLTVVKHTQIFLIKWIALRLSHGVENEHKSEEMSEVGEMDHIWAAAEQTLTQRFQCCWQRVCGIRW